MSDKLIEAMAKAIYAQEAARLGNTRSWSFQTAREQGLLLGDARAALSAIEASGYVVMQKETMLAMIALTTEMAETLTYILNDVEPTEFALSSVAREKALAALAKARGEA